MDDALDLPLLMGMVVVVLGGDEAAAKDDEVLVDIDCDDATDGDEDAPWLLTIDAFELDDDNDGCGGTFSGVEDALFVAST
mmetsp:Transcript_25868/g.54674  ORF Transcript_25868/g.54674 Transcript_25868/m.54674 type:complete len:81 (-) Transcript_25868:1101-1343(-)